jgi:hypothetical protein
MMEKNMKLTQYLACLVVALGVGMVFVPAAQAVDYLGSTGVGETWETPTSIPTNWPYQQSASNNCSQASWNGWANEGWPYCSGVVEVKGVIVKAPSESIFAIGKKYVSPSFVSAIRMVRKVFPEIVKYGIDSIIVKPPVKTPDKTEDSTADPPDKKLVTEQPAPLFTISEEAPLTPREFTLVARGTNGSAVYSFEVIFDIETDMSKN